MLYDATSTIFCRLKMRGVALWTSASDTSHSARTKSMIAVSFSAPE